MQGISHLTLPQKYSEHHARSYKIFASIFTRDRCLVLVTVRQQVVPRLLLNLAVHKSLLPQFLRLPFVLVQAPHRFKLSSLISSLGTQLGKRSSKSRSASRCGSLDRLPEPERSKKKKLKTWTHTFVCLGYALVMWHTN